VNHTTLATAATIATVITPESCAPTEYGHPNPAPKRRVGAWIALVVAIAFLGSAGYFAYTHVIKEDSGVAACKAMRDNAASPTPDNPNAKITRAQYTEWRTAFSGSGTKTYGPTAPS
jgi:hypothetical protein